MPNYKGHLLGGSITFGLLSIFVLHPKIKGFILLATKTKELIACLLGSLAPDVDIRSKGRKLLYQVIALAIIMALMNGQSQIILISLLIIIFINCATHRGITHNPIFVVAAPFLLSEVLHHHLKIIPKLPTNLYIFFVGGALSHILLDKIPKKYRPRIFHSIDKWRF